MGSNNSWLHHQLQGKGLDLKSNSHDSLIIVLHKNKTYKIYVPTPHEYIISVSVVEEVKKIGANTISYANSWCSPSHEAMLFSEANNIIIITHGELFKRLSK